MRKLTPKQEKFVEEYLVDLNATQAAIRAGYHPKMAAQLVAKPSIQKAVEDAKKAQAKRVRITADDVLRDLIEIKDRCMQAVPVRNKDGEETGLYVFDAKAANQSLALIGKHLGMFVDKVDMKVSGGAAALALARKRMGK